MSLASDIATACASVPLVARWAPQIAAAAEARAVPGLITPAELALTLAALVARETGGRNILGDGGHGHGLGQVDDRSWNEWLHLHKNGLDPASNLDKAASIYVTYLGSIRELEAARNEVWSPEVLQRAACAAYNCGPARALSQLRLGVEHLDEHTTGHDYSAWVWRHREQFAAALAAARGADGGACA